MTPGKRGNRRPPGGLTTEEAALWEYVTLDVEPSRAKRRIKPVEVEEREPHRRVETAAAAPPPPRTVKARAPAPPAPKAAALTPKPVATVTLDRRKARRIAKGAVEIDARIDLHGMRQDEAHHALRSFVKRCHAEDMRMVLVITGKGGALASGSEGGDLMPIRERGILRRNVPRWLAEPDIAPFIAGTSSAHVRHGGDGALYVMLRRRR